jgi:hypothetical protein
MGMLSSEIAAEWAGERRVCDGRDGEVAGERLHSIEHWRSEKEWLFLKS